MKQEQGKRLTLSIIFSLIAVLCSYAINFFVTPYITEQMGAEAYGFVSLAQNFVSYAGIISLALNSYAVRFISVAYHKSEFEKANKYFSSIYYANLVLGCVILLITILFVQKLDLFLDVPKSIVSDVKILFVLVFINFFISTIITVYSASAYIVNHLELVGIFNTLSNLTKATALILMYIFFKPTVWYMGACAVLAGMITLYSNAWITRRYTPELKGTIKNYNWGYVKEVVGNGIWNSINSLGNILNSGLDLIISNVMLSSLVMGQLAIAKTISSVFCSMTSIICQPFQPIFLQSYSSGNTKELLGYLKFSMKISGMISNISFAGFVAIGMSFYKLWIPKQDIGLIYNLTMISIMGGIAEGVMYPAYYIYTLKIKNKVPCFVTMIGGMLNVVGMYLLISYTGMGVYSIVWTTAIIMSFINFLTNPLYMASCMEQKWWYFYPTIIRHVLSCCIMTVIFRCIANVLRVDSWMRLIGSVIVLGLVGILIHVVITMDKMDACNLKTHLRIFRK